MSVSPVSFQQWVLSSSFQVDLEAARRVFSHPGVGRRSALYIYLTLAVMPDLLEVEFENSNRLLSVEGIAADLARTKQFYEMIVGDDGRPGLRSAQVQSMVRHVGQAHTEYGGMANWMMAAMAHIIGLAPLHSSPPETFEASDQRAFVRYMRMAWSLMATRLPTSLAEIKGGDGRRVPDTFAVSGPTEAIIGRFREVMAARYGAAPAAALMVEVGARLPAPANELVGPLLTAVAQTESAG